MKKAPEILTPEKALSNIKNTAISTRVGDWGMESTYVKDLSSTKQLFEVLESALAELEALKRTVKDCIALLTQSGSNTKEQVLGKLRGLVE